MGYEINYENMAHNVTVLRRLEKALGRNGLASEYEFLMERSKQLTELEEKTLNLVCEVEALNSLHASNVVAIVNQWRAAFRAVDKIKAFVAKQREDK